MSENSLPLVAGVVVTHGTSTLSAAEKARILLMLALAKTDDPREIRRMFSEY